MRKLIEGITFALIFIGTVMFVMPAITDPKPPMPTVTVDGGGGIPVAQGSYCWSGLLSSKCVDMVSAAEVIDGQPISVTPGAMLLIDFEKEPLEGSLDVNRIKGSVIEAVTIQTGEITAPAEKGVYIYMISANWEDGSSSYAFSVKVE